jgi:hypothetical protein
MRSALVLLLLGISYGAFAAEPVSLHRGPATSLPFPRSDRAQSVWASGLCWKSCQSYCTAGLIGCLKYDAQGACLQATDRCDRYCQTGCRRGGGPLLPDFLDF